MKRLTHLSLFSGIGGADLAAEWAGFETVGFCEQNKFCQEHLAKKWPGVPIYEDIFTLTNETLVRRGIDTNSITLLTGGFPCQPFSHAGKRNGTTDERYLWPQMLRVIKEVRPTWICGENVAGLLSMEFPDWDTGMDGATAETVLAVIRKDLQEAGYQSDVYVLPAAAVGAWHRRERTFIVAHTEGREDNQRERRSMVSASSAGEGCNPTVSVSGENVVHTDDKGLERRLSKPECANQRIVGPGSLGYSTGAGLPDWTGGEMGQPQPLTEFERPGGREIERNFRGVAYGVSRRVDRLRALGNAIVPQQIYPVLKAIADYENEQAA